MCQIPVTANNGTSVETAAIASVSAASASLCTPSG
jgi:hypothetical protein